MEQDKLPCPSAEQPDRERFERVWRRVMPEDRSDCPFTLYGENESAEHRLMPPDGDVPTPSDKPTSIELGLAPMVPMLEPRPADADNDVPMLGLSSAVYGSMLQGMIADELCDARTYETMSRRVTGSTAKVLSGLAADERRHAKRLSVAYFLISGIRFWPNKLPGTPMNTFMGGVRSRFIAEQKGEAAYRHAAQDTADPSLRELFLELAADEAAHAWLLRGILEQL